MIQAENQSKAFNWSKPNANKRKFNFDTFFDASRNESRLVNEIQANEDEDFNIEANQQVSTGSS